MLITFLTLASFQGIDPALATEPAARAWGVCLNSAVDRLSSSSTELRVLVDQAFYQCRSAEDAAREEIISTSQGDLSGRRFRLYHFNNSSLGGGRFLVREWLTARARTRRGQTPAAHAQENFPVLSSLPDDQRVHACAGLLQLLSGRPEASIAQRQRFAAAAQSLSGRPFSDETAPPRGHAAVLRLGDALERQTDASVRRRLLQGVQPQAEACLDFHAKLRREEDARAILVFSRDAGNPFASGPSAGNDPSVVINSEGAVVRGGKIRLRPFSLQQANIRIGLGSGRLNALVLQDVKSGVHYEYPQATLSNLAAGLDRLGVSSAQRFGIFQVLEASGALGSSVRIEPPGSASGAH